MVQAVSPATTGCRKPGLAESWKSWERVTRPAGMKPFETACPQCDTRLRVKRAELVGRVVTCPSCSARFPIQVPATVPVTNQPANNRPQLGPQTSPPNTYPPNAYPPNAYPPDHHSPPEYSPPAYGEPGIPEEAEALAVGVPLASGSRGGPYQDVAAPGGSGKANSGSGVDFGFLHRAEHSRAEHSRAEHSRAEHSRAEGYPAEQDQRAHHQRFGPATQTGPHSAGVPVATWNAPAPVVVSENPGLQPGHRSMQPATNRSGTPSVPGQRGVSGQRAKKNQTTAIIIGAAVPAVIGLIIALFLMESKGFFDAKKPGRQNPRQDASRFQELGQEVSGTWRGGSPSQNARPRGKNSRQKPSRSRESDRKSRKGNSQGKKSAKQKPANDESSNNKSGNAIPNLAPLSDGFAGEDPREDKLLERQADASQNPSEPTKGSQTSGEEIASTEALLDPEAPPPLEPPPQTRPSPPSGGQKLGKWPYPPGGFGIGPSNED